MTPKDLPVDIDRRYFEDYAPGTVVEYGPIAVDEDEIVAFARRYDPQPIHVDRERAARGPFGGVIASGWHTAALMMRLLVDHFLSRTASLASPGIDELRWLAPVRPGDKLSVRVTVLDARRSTSKPDRGIVRSSIEVRNDRAEVVMTVKAISIFLCRNPGAATDTPAKSDA
ncbi:MAG: MaoC family dehydratase [Burkholderiaceae bacterium]